MPAWLSYAIKTVDAILYKVRLRGYALFSIQKFVSSFIVCNTSISYRVRLLCDMDLKNKYKDMSGNASFF